MFHLPMTIRKETNMLNTVYNGKIKVKGIWLIPSASFDDLEEYVKEKEIHFEYIIRNNSIYILFSCFETTLTNLFTKNNKGEYIQDKYKIPMMIIKYINKKHKDIENIKHKPGSFFSSFYF